MNNDQPPSAPSGSATPRATEGERRVRDRRAPWRMWIPTYVLDYLDRIGDPGLALYAILAWHCTRESPVRWPSMNQLARRMGCSRSKIERTMRVLKDVGLVATSPCYDVQGQHSNYFDLTDPPEFREQSGSHGAPVAGAFMRDGAPPSVVTGGDVKNDGAPPSPMTAPSLEEDLKELCVEEGATHTPCAALTIRDALDAIARLSAHWKAHNGPGSPAWFEEQAVDFAWAAKLALSRNWTEEQLSASIADPARPVGEWPREWIKRLGPRPPRPNKTPPPVAEQRQKATEAAETLSAHQQTDSYKQALHKLRAAIGRPVDEPEV